MFVWKDKRQNIWWEQCWTAPSRDWFSHFSASVVGVAVGWGSCCVWGTAAPSLVGSWTRLGGVGHG